MFGYVHHTRLKGLRKEKMEGVSHGGHGEVMHDYPRENMTVNTRKGSPFFA